MGKVYGSRRIVGGGGGTVWEEFAITQDTSTQFVDLYTVAGSKNTANRNVKITVTNGAWVNAGMTTDAIGGRWGANLNLWLVIDPGSVIAGVGGTGGGGDPTVSANLDGQQGGIALIVRNSLKITNNGIIAGGGGGGGAGASWKSSPGSIQGSPGNASGGGGGGGRGGRYATTNGSTIGLGKGGPGVDWYGAIGDGKGNPGNDSGDTGPGGGGSGGTGSTGGSYGADGGAGGAWGAAGAAGNYSGQVYNQYSNGNGGAAGLALRVDSGTVTWQPRGTIYGSAPA